MTGKVLITGAFGFIGSRLAVCLAKAGYTVLLGSRKNYKSPLWLPKAEVVQTIWNDVSKLKRILKDVDIIIHTAGMNAHDCAMDPVAALTFNGLATARLVAAANLLRVKKLIYLSTAHVYRNPLTGKITEETCTVNLHPYATSNLAGEHAVLFGAQHGQTQSIVLRLSNAFGSPVHKHSNCWKLLVNDLCRQAVKDGELVLHSNCFQERDFIPITDVENVIKAIIQSPSNINSPDVYNLGRGISISIGKIAQLVAERYQNYSPSLVKIKNNKAISEPENVKLDYRVDKISYYGYLKPTTKIEHEIDKILEFCIREFSY